MPRAGTIVITIPFAAINLNDLSETCHELPGSTLYGTQTELILMLAGSIDRRNPGGPRPAHI